MSRESLVDIFLAILDILVVFYFIYCILTLLFTQ